MTEDQRQACRTASYRVLRLMDRIRYRDREGTIHDRIMRCRRLRRSFEILDDHARTPRSAVPEPTVDEVARGIRRGRERERYLGEGRKPMPMEWGGI